VTPAVRLAAFALAVIGAFGGAYAVGASVDPVVPSSASAHDPAATTAH
jgi:hypothetical protein